MRSIVGACPPTTTGQIDAHPGIEDHFIEDGMGGSGLGPGVTFIDGRVTVVAEELAHNFIVARTPVEEDFGCRMPELMGRQTNA